MKINNVKWDKLERTNNKTEYYQDVSGGGATWRRIKIQPTHFLFLLSLYRNKFTRRSLHIVYVSATRRKIADGPWRVKEWHGCISAKTQRSYWYRCVNGSVLYFFLLSFQISLLLSFSFSMEKIYSDDENSKQPNIDSTRYVGLIYVAWFSTSVIIYLYGMVRMMRDTAVLVKERKSYRFGHQCHISCGFFPTRQD